MVEKKPEVKDPMAGVFVGVIMQEVEARLLGKHPKDQCRMLNQLLSEIVKRQADAQNKIDGLDGDEAGTEELEKANAGLPEDVDTTIVKDQENKEETFPQL